MDERSRVAARVQFDCERLVDELAGARVGVVTHAGAWIDGRGPFVETMARHLNVVTAFAPEHGLWGASQAGETVEDSVDDALGISVLSLYGERRAPTADELGSLDAIVFCAQGVGCRSYTYHTTMARCLLAAAESGTTTYVLDRPNPLGGETAAGPVAATPFFPEPIPVRHGLTVGELAQLLAARRGLTQWLRVISMRGWQRWMHFRDTGLAWTPPSPNIPTPETAMAFAAFHILEGTNLSEGRGTTTPFQVLGAPFVEPFKLRDALRARQLPGCDWQPVRFRPTFSKHQGLVCGGVRWLVLDCDACCPVRTGLEVLACVIELWPDQIVFRDTAFDHLCGDATVRRQLLQRENPVDIASQWQQALADFRTQARRHWLYGGKASPA